MNDDDILAAVEEQRGTTLDAMRFVHAHPELAYEEHACAEFLAATLGEELDVERGLAGMATGFSAVIEGARPGRTVGLVLVYDAVAVARENDRIDAVHSCGHGPIAGGVVGAALGLATLRRMLRGTVVVYGCPADELASPGAIEAGGGKTRSLAAGAWERVDAALYPHPEALDAVWEGSPWMRRVVVTVSGVDGPAARLEGIDGIACERVDVAPPRGGGTVTRMTVRLSADDERGLAEREELLRKSLPITEWRAAPLVGSVRSDESVAAAVADAFAARGRTLVANPPRLPFSNDFGNITQRVPAALMGVGHPIGWALHSDEGAAQFQSAEGEACAALIADLVALTTLRLLEL